jgi:hypothetical protein
MLLKGRGDGGVWSLGHLDFFLYRVGGWGVDAVSQRRSRLGRVRMYWVNITTRDDSLIEDELQSFMISRWCNRPDDVRVH